MYNCSKVHELLFMAVLDFLPKEDIDDDRQLAGIFKSSLSNRNCVE
jgi:hypothetical protein